MLGIKNEMKKRRNGKDYEKIVADLGKALFELAEKGGKFEVKYGDSNKWIGISGYAHQIDVSLNANNLILLVECKNWGSNVDVPSFLTFLARVIDIKSKYSDKEIHGKVVTTLDYDPGVKMLASYYDIDLDRVKNKNEFLLKFKKYGIVGVADQATGTDRVSVNRQCSACGSELYLKVVFKGKGGVSTGRLLAAVNRPH